MFPGTCGSDAVVLEGDTFDSCSGHSSSEGIYHYHVTPSCLLDQLGDYYNVTEHSPQIGWAFDGFPVYGPHGPGGDLIYPCNHTLANASACLDDCGGTEQYVIDDFLYHYHIVGPIGDLVSSPVDPLPNTSMVPYTIGCFKGVVYDWSILQGDDNNATCDRDGYKPSYTATVTEGVTAIYGTTTTTTSTPTTSNPTTSSPTTSSPSSPPTTSSPTTSSPSTAPTVPITAPSAEPTAAPIEPTAARTRDTEAPSGTPTERTSRSSPTTSSPSSEATEIMAFSTVEVDEDESKGVLVGGTWGWKAIMVAFTMWFVW